MGDVVISTHLLELINKHNEIALSTHSTIPQTRGVPPASFDETTLPRVADYRERYPHLTETIYRLSGLELETGAWTDVLVERIAWMRELASSDRFDHHFDAVVGAVEDSRGRLDEAPAILIGSGFTATPPGRTAFAARRERGSSTGSSSTSAIRPASFTGRRTSYFRRRRRTRASFETRSPTSRKRRSQNVSDRRCSGVSTRSDSCGLSVRATNRTGTTSRSHRGGSPPARPRRRSRGPA
ncbi:hypothetical protein Natoc_2548 [Natronococcus occultus SP4]|uniref:Uncharacterized protein n=1 Tax=Natronococcus occultus SP4 TaxID=694430 RepID=L0JZ65_9EURY|nr:hypothetical protein Natoc_2548 [Natronococcus occultus SP4]